MSRLVVRLRRVRVMTIPSHRFCVRMGLPLLHGFVVGGHIAVVAVPARVFRPFVILVLVVHRIRPSYIRGHVLHVTLPGSLLILITPKTIDVLVDGVRLSEPLICRDEVPDDIDTQRPGTSSRGDDIQQGVDLIGLNQVGITVFKSNPSDIVLCDLNIGF